MNEAKSSHHENELLMSLQHSTANCTTTTTNMMMLSWTENNIDDQGTIEERDEIIQDFTNEELQTAIQQT